MRFLVDAQLPPALARWLSAQGHDAFHVSDKGLQAASDSAIWEYALDASAVIITKDEDFTQRKIMVPFGPIIVWVRVPNARRRDLLVWFERILPDLMTALDRGETLIEIV